MFYAVSLLCGAGASLPFGVPVMSGFYKEFRDYISTRRAHCYSIIEDIETNIEDFRPDLEILLSSLESIIQTERGAELIGLSDTNLAKKVELAKELTS